MNPNCFPIQLTIGETVCNTCVPGKAFEPWLCFTLGQGAVLFQVAPYTKFRDSDTCPGCIPGSSSGQPF